MAETLLETTKKMSGNERLKGFPCSEMSAFRSQRWYHRALKNMHDRRKAPEYDAEKISRVFAKMISVEADFPPKIIESFTFRKFVSQLMPYFHLGTHDILKDDCLKLYNEERSKIKYILRDFDGLLSLSVEKLKCRAGNVYMSLNAHFVDDSWERRKWVLWVWNASEYSLSDAVSKCLSYWKIDDKIFSITLKSGVQADETVQKLNDRIQKKYKLLLEGRLLSVSCCADLINSMLNIVVDEISDFMDKVLEFRDSASPDEYDKSSRTKLGKKLPLWHIYCLMLKEVVLKNPPHEYMLSAEELKVVEGVCELVNKLQNLGKMLFRAKYSASSIFLSNLQEFHANLSREAKNADGLVGKTVAKLLEKLDKYLEHTFLVLSTAAVIDPRCKILYMEYLSLKFPELAHNSQPSIVLEALHTIYDEYAANTPQEEDFDSEYSDFERESCHVEKEDDPNKKIIPKVPKFEEDDKLKNNEMLEKKKDIPNGEEENATKGDVGREGENKDHPKKRRKVEEIPEGKHVITHDAANHLDGYKELVQSFIQPPKSDLKRYLEEPVEPWSQELNLLDWWRDASCKYPVLSKMARDILSIPLSVFIWSDLCDTEERKVDSYLSSCGQALLNALTCLRSWKNK